MSTKNSTQCFEVNEDATMELTTFDRTNAVAERPKSERNKKPRRTQLIEGYRVVFSVQIEHL